MKRTSFWLLLAAVLLAALAGGPVSVWAEGWQADGRANIQCWGAAPPIKEHIWHCGDISVAKYCFYHLDSMGHTLCNPSIAGAYIKEGYSDVGAHHSSVASVNGTWAGYQNACKTLYSTCCSSTEDGQCWLWYEFGDAFTGQYQGFAWPNGRNWRPPGK